ncbi:MAG: hypothetical protein A2V86_04265 [Deltaproteobacteria bacterium RBG_16_49_23]|nr:MAG: hypothetical protein A2V86_04265 [Deltaproteobacteria bacterium RBG_16_49_23]
MPSRIRRGLLLIIAIITLLFASTAISYGEAIDYIYDELNRLKRIKYADGTVIEFTYDKTGNRTVQIIDTTPPTTTAVPAGGIFNTAQSVTLTCNDGTGLGCEKIYFTTNGQNPDINSPSQSSPVTLNISVPTTLKFFARDLANHSESIKTQIYTIDSIPPTGTITINRGATYTNSINVTLTLTCNDDLSGCSQMQFKNDNGNYSNLEPYAATKAWSLTPGSGTKYVYVKFQDLAGNWSNPFSDTVVFNSSCSNSTVRIGTTSYTSLQSAYNAASNGNVIKVQGIMLIENLTVNRNISVTLEGGYDCGFTSNYGNMTAIKGSITTTVGGGTLTIKNFILSQ